jgi:ketosteroid isomerase-like protein
MNSGTSIITNNILYFSFRWILLILVITACQGEKSSNVEQEKNVAIVKKSFELFNKHDWKSMAALYRNPAAFKDPSFGQDVVEQTHDQIIKKYTEMATMSPDIKDDVVEIYPSGDKYVTVEFVSSGTSPDGTKWSLPICTILTLEDGQIVKDYTYYDVPAETPQP